MRRRIGMGLLIAVMSVAAIPQGPAANAIALAETGNYTSSIADLQNLAASDPKAFTANNYDYLLARYAESDGQLGLAMVNYQNVAARDSLLAPYALKHLSQIARSTGNLMLERLYLQQIVLLSPDSLLAAPARQRIARNNFESGNYTETIRLLNGGYGGSNSPSKKNSTNLREDQALLAEANLRSGKADVAREIFNNLLATMPNAQVGEEFSPVGVVRQDARMQHVVIGEHDTGGLAYGGAMWMGGVAIIDGGCQGSRYQVPGCGAKKVDLG